MNAITFDTLQFANRLKAVGFTDDQAQVLTELQRDACMEILQAIRDYDFKRRVQSKIETEGNKVDPIVQTKNILI